MALDLNRAYRLNPAVSLRPEPFGALAYHFGNRRLATVCLPDRPQAGPGHSRRQPGRSDPVFVPVDLIAVRAAT